MPGIVDAADQLTAADLPVIFLDTCSILDLIRSIHRQHKNCVASGHGLVMATQTVPRTVSVVVSHLVRHEWNANADEELTRAKGLHHPGRVSRSVSADARRGLPQETGVLHVEHQRLSNTNDYCGESGLHAKLAIDFADVGLRFTSNLPWGFHDVTH